jgi:hypothetical protein
MADANVENGASIIESAGVGVRKVPVRTPRVFEAKPGLVSGLAPGATVQFRYRPVTKVGEGDWSQTVVLIVK